MGSTSSRMAAARRRIALAAGSVALAGALGLTGLAPAQAAAPAPAAVVQAPHATATGACKTTLTAGEREILIKESDTRNLTEVQDALDRLKRINKILAERGNYRGTFPVFYEVILTRTIHVMNTEKFNDPVWSKKIAVEFVSEYFRNLHGHLTGGKVTTYWQEFYKLAADCNRSAGRVAAQALVTHMVDDFPRALVAVGTKYKNRADFLHYGDALIAATPDIIKNVQKYYGVNLQPLFQMYAFGDLFGSSNVTTAFFSSVRSLAWSNYEWLDISAFIGRSKIAFYWSTASSLMASFERQGKL